MTEREREKLDPRFVSFRFIFCLHVVFQTNVAKDKQEFSPCFIFVQSFVARCCKMQCVCVCAQRRTIGKVTDPITTVMAVRHFVSRSRLIAPKSLATV